MRRNRGLTLIELLVAISIFAILGVMSYRAISQAVHNREQLEAQYSQWQQLARTFSRIESDIQQLGIRQATTTNPNARAPLWVGQNAAGHTRIVFWRMDAELGARLTGFEFSGTTFDLLRWPSADLTVEPHREVLLQKVTFTRWQFLDEKNLQWLPTWPVEGGNSFDIPSGIRLELDQEGTGKITRTFALQ